MRRLLLALCCLPACALAQSAPPTALGRLVVLGPKCDKRPDQWGQRLDVALGDGLRQAQGEAGLRDLAQTELDTFHEWQADPAKACATVDTDALQQADRLVGP